MVRGGGFRRFVADLCARVRRRPLVWTAAAVTSVLVAVAGGWYGTAFVQWRRAEADARAEQFPAAEERLAFCRRVWPNDRAVWLLSAQVSRKMGDLSAAEERLTHCLRTGPTDQAVQVEYLLLRAQGGDDAVADPLFALVEDGYPDSETILDTLSLAYMRRLRYMPANACLSRWIDLNGAAKAYYRRGWVYERTGNSKLAAADYQAALDRDPTLTDVRLRLVELLLADKQVVEAVPHLDVLVAQGNRKAEVDARLGMCRFLQGQTADARRLLEAAEAAGLPKDDATPLVVLARLDVQDQDGAAAERRLRKVIAADPTELEARFVLLSALRLQGKDAEADREERDHARVRERNERVTLLLRDFADQPAAPTGVWCEIASLFLEMGMESRAAYWFDKVLARDPTHPEANRKLAEMYARRGDEAAADRHRRAARTDDR